MNKHVLIVDDTPDLQENIKEILEMEGYTISQAVNGRDALKVLQQISPDLIITDLLMPEMSGFDLIARVRENAAWNSIVILVYSAMPTQENESKALHLGANAYLKKPGTIEILVETVSRLVK
jgi:DNA-binding response OmpR family regulator